MITQQATQKTRKIYCPTAKKRIPKERCPGACYICTKEIREGKETYHWSD